MDPLIIVALIAFGGVLGTAIVIFATKWKENKTTVEVQYKDDQTVVFIKIP